MKQYKPTQFSSTLKFSQTFREKCIQVNSMLFSHHHMDAVVDQPGRTLPDPSSYFVMCADH
jgi:hypothetical protein